MRVEAEQIDSLMEAAREAQLQAHAPYSQFRVGAAVLAESGKVYPGCNVENASFGATICAERAAVCAAVVAGERRFKAIAVYAESAQPPMPCGVCRQFLAEFGLDTVVACEGMGGRTCSTVAELLPQAFTADTMAPDGEPGAL